MMAKARGTDRFRMENDVGEYLSALEIYSHVHRPRTNQCKSK
jgi:hypothetical protein